MIELAHVYRLSCLNDGHRGGGGGWRVEGWRGWKGWRNGGVERRRVWRCMSTHLNANANVSLDSNANTNAIFQERMQMQMFWGRIQMQMQMFWGRLHICKCI